MSDIFREIDEEVRRDQFRKIWERYGALIVALALLLVASVGGWRAYEWWQARQAAATGTAFEAAILLAEEGKTAEAEAAYGKLAAEGTPIYRILARMREASEVAKRDAKAAIAIYDQVATERATDPIMRDAATLRAAYLAVDIETYADLLRRLEPLTAADRTFRHSARALLALAAWRAKDTAELKRWTGMIAADGETPDGTRAQVEMLMALTGTEAKS